MLLILSFLFNLALMQPTFDQINVLLESGKCMPIINSAVDRGETPTWQPPERAECHV